MPRLILRDFTLSLWYSWDFRPYEILRGVSW